MTDRDLGVSQCWGSAGGNKGLAAAVGIVGVGSLALIYFVPSTPSKVVMATGGKGSILEYFGRQYQETFARSGVELDLRETVGSFENLEFLLDPKSGLEIAFVIGGVSDGKHAPGLLSLGSVYNTPYWIFYSSGEPFDRSSQLKGKRIAIGPVRSGARILGEKFLGKGGVTSENATFLPLTRLAAVEALKNGKVDAVSTVGNREAANVHALLQNSNARIMNFAAADAFTILFPELLRLVLPQGVIDIERNIPPNDVALVGAPSSRVAANSGQEGGARAKLVPACAKKRGHRGNASLLHSVKLGMANWRHTWKAWLCLMTGTTFLVSAVLMQLMAEPTTGPGWMCHQGHNPECVKKVPFSN